MMTKWDTIQADVADMYIGLVENEELEKARADYDSEDYVGAEDLFDEDEDVELTDEMVDKYLTLDWNE